MSQPPEDRPPEDRNDPIKALWQGQDQETPTMTVQAIRMLVRDNAASVRHRLMFGVAVAVAVVGIFGWSAWTAPVPLLRVADLIMLGWAPFMLWILYRQIPRQAPGAEASAQGLIEFYRAQLSRQAPNLPLIALALTPIGVGLALVIIAVWEKARHRPEAMLFFAVLIVAWVASFVFGYRRQKRRVADRLRELDALRG